VTSGLFAQQRSIDSLQLLITNAPSDTIKVKALYRLSMLYQNTNPSQAVEYATQGLDLSQKTGDENGVSICLNSLGTAYYNLGNFDAALDCFEKRFYLTAKIRDTLGIAGSMDNISTVLVHKGELDKALDLRRKSNEIYLNIGDLVPLANGYVWIGNIYKNKGDLEEALRYYLEANKIFEANHKEDQLAFSFVNMSSIYRALKQYDKSIQFALQAKEIFYRSGDLNATGVSLYRLALAYDESGEQEKAVTSMEEARVIFIQVGNDYFLHIINNYLGNKYRDNQKYDRALECYNASLAYGYVSGNKELISTSLHNIATVLSDKRDTLAAIESLRQAEKIYHEINDINHLCELYFNYVVLYNQLNQRDSVYKYLYVYGAYRDSVVSEQTIRAVTELQTKYDSEKKEKEIALLNLENEKKQNNLESLNRLNEITNLKLLQSTAENENYQQSLELANAERESQRHEIELFTLNEKLHNQALEQEKKVKRLISGVFAISILAVVISSYFVFLGFRNKKKKEEALLKQTAAELNRQLIENNMKAINVQLTPHFIFNCVHTVEYFLGESNIKESIACLRKFSDLTRMILESMSKKEIPLERELDILRNYMDLEQMRHFNKFSYKIDIDPSVNHQITMVPPLIMQPFVENSIKHGFIKQKDSYEIRIHIGMDSGKLLCEIVDNGVGLSEKKPEEHLSGFKKESLGLKLTEERLRLINEMTRSESSYSIRNITSSDNTSSGTIVLLLLPNVLAA